MKYKKIFSAVCVMMTALLVVTAQAKDLSYKHINLDAAGIHKGVALPSDPGTSLFGLTFVTGAEGLPEHLPTNALLLFPITDSQWANGSYDASGNKVEGVGNISANALILRGLYIWPKSLQPSSRHWMLSSDFVLPAMVNIHVNAGAPGTPKGLGVGGSSVGDISFAPVALVFKGYNYPSITVSGYIGLLINFPTGSYSKNNAFNVGSNEYSFTFLTNPIITFPHLNLYWDQELQYTHTTIGNGSFVLDANPAANELYTGKPISRYTTGDLLTYNSDLLYKVSETLAVGPSMAVMSQLSNDKWNHVTVKNSKQYSLAVGLGLQYKRGPISFQVKYLDSVDAKNGPRYNTVWAQLSIPFLF